MNFKLSLISTALLTSFSISTFAETEQTVDTTPRRLSKLTFKIRELNKMVIKRQEHQLYQKLKCQYSTRQTQ